MYEPATTGRRSLETLRIASDRLTVSPSGGLEILGRDADALLMEFGSPLYVTVEPTIRENFRRFRDAFSARWPSAVNVMYAIKANDCLAVRAILSTEGAGGDCFGLGELRATLSGGADPARVVMNGSNKSREEIAAAVAAGIAINLDGEEEIAMVAAIAEAAQTTARVNLRLKLLPAAFEDFGGTFFKAAGSLREAVRRSKWGYTVETTAALVRAVQARPSLDLRGFSAHVGRFAAQPEAYALVARAMGQAAAELHAATGVWPTMLDIGGGWARQREPESRAPDLNPLTIEQQAEAATGALLESLTPTGKPMPELWLEPGRYIIGNAVVLLARVGAVKRDAGMCWVHVDASTNDLMRIETSQAWYHVLPATRMDDPQTETVEVVGGTCIPSIIGAGRRLPPMRRGDAVAILDAGMYAEAISNQFNSIPRPANLLVSETGAEVIKRRETLDDLFARHIIPARLAPGRN